MAMSQFFIISNNGDILIFMKYRHDVRHNSAELFREKLQRAENASLLPHLQTNGVSVFHISRPPGLIVGCTCPTVDPQDHLLPVVMIEQLSHLYQVVKDFCGKLTEESIRTNTALIHEVLDECIDNGHFQLCSTEKLKPFIQSDPEILRTPENSTPGLFGIEHKLVPGEASSRSVIQPRSLQEQRKNEIFVDVIEKISTLINTNGQIMRCEVRGEVRMKSFLVGSAHIKMGLNENLTVGREPSQRGYGRAVHLAECHFHPAVGLSEFDSSRILAINPPEGEFSVMKYTLTEDLPHGLPIRVFSYVRDNDSARDVEIGLQLRCETSSQCHAIDVTAHLPVPKSTSSITQNLSGPGQTAKLDVSQKKVVWSIKKIPGKGEVSAHFKLIGAKEGGSGVRSHLGPVAVDFEVSGFVCSQLQVRFLRVFDRENSYVPHRWLRYISTADSYVVKII